MPEIFNLFSAKPRSCLKCGTVFMSRGCGNRICESCINENEELSMRAIRPIGWNDLGELAEDTKIFLFKRRIL